MITTNYYHSSGAVIAGCTITLLNKWEIVGGSKTHRVIQETKEKFEGSHPSLGSWHLISLATYIIILPAALSDMYKYMSRI